MSLLNKQNIKLLAKSYGKQVHDKDLQISSDFISQIEDLVDAVVRSNVAKQDKLLGTQKATEWGHKCLQDADAQLEGSNDEV